MSDNSNITYSIRNINSNNLGTRYFQVSITYFLADQLTFRFPVSQKDNFRSLLTIRIFFYKPRELVFLQINSSTGLLSSKQPIDYEAHTSIDFEVVTTDSGVSSLSGSASVRVTITDVNDNRPVFSCINKNDAEYYEAGEECFYNLEVRSDSLIEYTIMKITATDADKITRKRFSVSCFITSNDCSFGSPIICTDINSKCYFVHYHLNNA